MPQRYNDPVNEFAAQRAALPGDLIRAIRWLSANLSEPIQLDVIARAADTRPRTLERHFKTYLGTTPLGWVRRARLAAARRELGAGRNQSVTAIALANGFGQVGRFAGQYKRTFGELPSQTLAKSMHGHSAELDEAIRLTFAALPLAFAVEKEQCDGAIEQLEIPQQLAPNYSLAKAATAWCWAQRAAHNFSDTTNADRQKAIALAQSPGEDSANDPLALTFISGTLVLLHQLEEADQYLERALALEPWLAYGWVRRGWMSAYFGDFDGAIRELRIALALAPYEPLKHIIFIGMGCSHFGAERYDQAARWILSALDEYPRSYWAQRIAVAAMALYGSRAEARRLGRQIMRREPALTVDIARRAWPFTPSFNSRLADGLERVELPRA